MRRPNKVVARCMNDTYIYIHVWIHTYVYVYMKIKIKMKRLMGDTALAVHPSLWPSIHANTDQLNTLAG